MLTALDRRGRPCHRQSRQERQDVCVPGGPSWVPATLPRPCQILPSFRWVCLGLAGPPPTSPSHWPLLSSVDARPPAIPGARSHPIPEFDPRAPHPAANLQNFYAAQRHQPSRGSNEAEQMMQAKRRMAAQRERELRNYHQEQQYNRSRPPSSVWDQTSYHSQDKTNKKEQIIPR